ncbi:MAG: helix-turn-helix domain-containing protein [Phycisphaerales bacterium]|nr:helix-turn-helix domain-containing protein [Phycisphaerales bacterium]
MSRHSRIRLTDEQTDELDTFRMRARTPATYRNATIILMSDAGRSKASIAEALGCGTATVERVRRLYSTMGIVGLTPIKPPGRPSRLSNALREPVLQAIQVDPRTLIPVPMLVTDGRGGPAGPGPARL